MATPILLGAPRPAPRFAPLFVAIDRGFLADEDLAPSIHYSFEPSEHEPDFWAGGVAYKTYLGGEDIRMIAGFSTNESSHVLIVRESIESPQQLEEVLLSGGYGASRGRFIDELNRILAANGVNVEDSRIEMPGIEGSHKEQWEMLQQGIGDGATLGAPYWVLAVKAGYRNLGGASDFSSDPSGSGLYTRPETIAARPEVVRAFVRAYTRAMAYCIENPEGAIDTILRYSQEWGVSDHDIAQATYDEVAPYWTADVDLPSLRRLTEKECEKLGRPPVPVEAFTDLSFLTEVTG